MNLLNFGSCVCLHRHEVFFCVADVVLVRLFSVASSLYRDIDLACEHTVRTYSTLTMARWAPGCN
jgi:hypothetical protein